MLIDTHCHLDSTYFPEGPDAALLRATELGVGGFVCIGVGDTLEPAKQAVALAARRPDVWATAGVHPHDAKTLVGPMREQLRALCQQPRVVALGEVGLDYHYDNSPRETQREVFRSLIELAKELALPLVVHTREAADDTIAILTESGARDVGGIIHCFSETPEFARKALDLGFYLSFSGIVTFKNALPIHETARIAPADRILVETDAPYLSPIPHRGKPCEPAFVVHTAKRVAELRGVDEAEFAEQTTRNARTLLRLA